MVQNANSNASCNIRCWVTEKSWEKLIDAMYADILFFIPHVKYSTSYVISSDTSTCFLARVLFKIKYMY